jgi:hypothetical protein
MVPTVVERDGTIDAVQMTRRAVVLCGAAVVLAGCRTKTTPTPAATTQSPDAAALRTARSTEQSLLASYDARIASLPLHKRAPLQVELAIHATHLESLHGVTPPASSPTPSASSLRRAVRASARQLRGLSLAAIDGGNAALLASIAASHTASAG